MEECGSAGCAHPWKAATMKRKAWALSRGSWQASESQDGHGEGQPSQEPAAHKVPLAEEPGRIPNKIASWLKECRTPLGASLDEQSNTPSKGELPTAKPHTLPARKNLCPVKNTCSFEDDLSLGAEANHLRDGGNPSEIQRLGMLAQEKRTQFKQKGRSMNSTGSGRSNTTVSSVSELLDLYEEDPEEILYNLGFGREEPDIASKIPSRFFNTASHARGIDIKVYLGAQLQRLELENPNYALTSRFRQIEVLTTVANAFSSLYSQVSGTPVQKIGSSDTEHKEAVASNRTNSALNAAKILKKTVTRRNLLAAADGPTTASPETEGVKKLGDSSHEQAPKTKDQPSLATVAEESHQGVPDVTPGDPHNIDQPIGDKEEVAEESNSSLSADSNLGRGKDQAVTSTPAKELISHRPHPCITHLLSQAKDSFEMEEVQSNEGEGPTGIISSSKEGNELLLRMASQHSDSSGFAEDPSTDGSASHLKVQESSDSCDSETTVTSTAGELSTPLAIDHPAFQKLQGEEVGLTGIGSESPSALDCPAFQKLPGEEKDLMAIGTNGALALDHSTFQKPEGEEAGQMVASRHSPREQNTCLLSWNQGKPKGEEEETSVEETSVEETSVEETSVEETSVEETSVEETSVEETSVEETSVKEKAVEEKAVEEEVVEEEIVEEKEVEEKVIPEYVPHLLPQSTVTEMQKPKEPSSSGSPTPGSPTEDWTSAQISSAVEPGSEDTQDRLHAVPDWPRQTAPWERVRGLQLGQDRYPLRRSSSLPVSLLSPSRVVSSVKIRLHPGSARHCTPPSFSYRYTPENEGEDGTGSIAEKEEAEEEDRAPCRSTLIINAAPKERDVAEELRVEDGPPSRMPPYPLHLPGHLTRSSCSLHSTPPNWPERPMCDLPRAWSTCSMPTLSAHSAPYGSPLDQPHSAPYSLPHSQPHSAPYSLPHSQPHSTPYNLPHSQPHSTPYNLPHGQPHSAPYNLPHNQPHSTPYNLPHGQPHSAPYNLPHNQPHNTPYNLPHSQPHSAPYNLPNGQPQSASYNLPHGQPHSAPYNLPHSQPHSAPYGSLFSQLHNAPYSSPLSQPHAGPYGLPLGHPHSAPYHYGIPQSSRWNSPFNAPFSAPYGHPYSSNCCTSYPAACSPLAAAPVRPAQPPSSMEMQLRRVLHDVRSAVQNLAQSSSLQGEDMVTPLFSPHRAVHPLYDDTIQELQVIKRNLNVFRTQMMDLEFALLRQQDMVYQHLTEEDRQEAEHLQSLRSAVRQELQELELQLEDRLLFLDEQLRTSHYHHPVGISRGHSMDSRCSTPPMNVTEPVTELLREQQSLQAELGLQESEAPPLSSCSSRSVSPSRPSRAPGPPVSDCPSPHSLEVYRTFVCLTPTLPPRHQEPEFVERSDCAPLCSPPESRGGAGAARDEGATGERGVAENPQLQQLINEIKQSITDEIRQEIVSDLLAAVLPRRSPVTTQEHVL